MGDTVVNVILNLKTESEDDGGEQKLKKFNKILSSDTSFREVYDWVKKIAYDENCRINGKDKLFPEKVHFVMYDCTTYPIKKIELDSGKNDAIAGHASVTLFSLGWFPSARIAVFYINDEDGVTNLTSHSSTRLHDADLWFEHKTEFGDNTNPVTLIGEWEHVAKPSPSELLESVVHRHDKDDASTMRGRTTTNGYKQKDIQRSESIRMSKLDEKIKALEKNSKSDNVSAQVRRMLIKSRAKGKSDFWLSWKICQNL